MTVAFATPYRCINRNIVECKFYFTSSIWLSTVSVLIETLWNVNSFYSSPNNVGSSVFPGVEEGIEYASHFGEEESVVFRQAGRAA